MKLVIWSELANGGIADYAHDQATALAARGIEVEMLCPPSFIAGRTFSYAIRPVLRDLRPVGPSASRAIRAWRLIVGLLANARIVARHVEAHRPDAVLTHFSEYLAPLWAWRMQRLRRNGISFHSVLHDPIRDYAVGPKWWHTRSVRAAFAFLDTVFVHQRDVREVPPPAKIVWLPHGIYRYPAPSRSRAAMREALGIPEDATLLTSFGYIRDNKNLDLIIAAIAPLPQVYLLVAGSEQAGGNRPVAFYRELADRLGCAERCRWETRFLTQEESADVFAATDLSLLVYAQSFMSSSGALGVAANYQVPSLISSGSSSTREMVEEYKLGLWVEPNVEAIRSGLTNWSQGGGLRPEWDRYARENSWARNAEIVERTIFGQSQK